MKTSMCWLASLLLCAGCNPLHRPEVLSDPLRPHQLAEDTTLLLLLRQPDGVTYTPGWVAMPKGAWIATEEAIRHPEDAIPVTPTQPLGLGPAPAK